MKFKIQNVDSWLARFSIVVIASVALSSCGASSKPKNSEIRPAAGTIAQEFATAIAKKQALELPDLSAEQLGEFLKATAEVHEIMLELVGYFESQYPKDRDHAMLKQWRLVGWRPFYDLLNCRVDGRIEESKPAAEKHFRMSYEDRGGFKRHTVLILKKDAQGYWKVVACKAIPVLAPDVGEIKSQLNKLRYSHGTALAALKKAKPQTIDEAIRLYSLVSNRRNQELKPNPSPK